MRNGAFKQIDHEVMHVVMHVYKNSYTNCTYIQLVSLVNRKVREREKSSKFVLCSREVTGLPRSTLLNQTK